MRVSWMRGKQRFKWCNEIGRLNTPWPFPQVIESWTRRIVSLVTWERSEGKTGKLLAQQQVVITQSMLIIFTQRRWRGEQWWSSKQMSHCWSIRFLSLCFVTQSRVINRNNRTDWCWGEYKSPLERSMTQSTRESCGYLIFNVNFYLYLCLVLKYISFTYRINCAMCEMNDLKDHLEDASDCWWNCSWVQERGREEEKKSVTRCILRGVKGYTRRKHKWGDTREECDHSRNKWWNLWFSLSLSLARFPRESSIPLWAVMRRKKLMTCFHHRSNSQWEERERKRGDWHFHLPQEAGKVRKLNVSLGANTAQCLAFIW